MNQSEKGASPKSYPIVFSGPMVRALLEGRKAQTRRLIKPQPEFEQRGIPGITGSIPKWILPSVSDCPYGQPCDLLWVRETWQTGVSSEGPQIAFASTRDVWDIDAWNGKDYGAGTSFNYGQCPKATWYTWLPDLLAGREGIWRPAIHIPRWASRLTLELIEVRVQRLQEISEEDARAEGLSILTKDDGRTWKYGIPDHDGLPGNDDDGWHWADWNADLRVAYARLWESLHGPGSWLANPWVWVVSFAVHRQNVDELLKQRSAA
jgi:hypothetical protein